MLHAHASSSNLSKHAHKARCLIQSLSELDLNEFKLFPTSSPSGGSIRKDVAVCGRLKAANKNKLKSL